MNRLSNPTRLLCRTQLSHLPSGLHPTPTTSRLISSTSRTALPSPTSPRQHPSRPRGPTSAQSAQNRSLLLYSAATIVLVGAASYLAVPLYRAFCSATGYAGTPRTDTKFDASRLSPDPKSDKRVRVRFNADASDSLPWTFTPQQKEVSVLPGETALAFYTAKNTSDDPIVGIATYNVTPNNVRFGGGGVSALGIADLLDSNGKQIAPYFAKVECFCFEEQRIQAHEEVDLPIFFFIDRDFLDDPLMKDVREVTLSYTFFRARRDGYGNLVPAEGPLAVAGSVAAV
ncbi:cytochrome c oxidase assembly protein subunit 11, partial [Phenoliferia sp. Uapishka_3]